MNKVTFLRFDFLSVYGDNKVVYFTEWYEDKNKLQHKKVVGVRCFEIQGFI